MLRQLLEAADYEVEAYSGRAMYGDEYISVNIDNDAELVKLGAKLMDHAIDMDCADELMIVLRTTRTESLGRGLVVYWPSQKWEDK